MKIDLHCHSRFSKRPTLWIMQKLGCPESFTRPQDLYEAALLRGMNMVTITDHNMIDGALEIAHQPNAFVSCEYTTYFPEDRCKVHVLVYGITEKQHAELQEARQNIFEFTKYVNDNGMAHACAHPLFGPNDRLKTEHIEKVILLFKAWERNGDLAPEMNYAMDRLLQALSPEHLKRLSEKHGIEPFGVEPWRKCIIAGSDDHSSLNLANTYTEVRGAADFAAFWEGVQNMQAHIHCQENTPRAFARSIYSIGYQYYQNRFNLRRYLHQDTFLIFIDRMLQRRQDYADSRFSRLQRYWSNRRQARQSRENMTLFQLARHEAWTLIQESPDFQGIADRGLPHGCDPNAIWGDFVNTLSNKLLVHLGNTLVERVAHARLFDLFHSLGSAAALYTVLAPYFVSYSHFVGQRAQAGALLGALDAGPVREESQGKSVAHFTDTFFEINGVARTLQQHLSVAKELGKAYHVIVSSAPNGKYVEGLYAFEPVGTWRLPEYPELELFAPPFLQILQHCYDAGYTHIHASTPGPMGLAALGIARILRLPISGTYHTAMPQYGRMLTEDSYVEDLLWKGMVAFYEQMDYVYAPSRATAQELIDKGLSPDKISIYPRGVNVERFNPGKRDPDLMRRHTGGEDMTIALYVGRVSREKSLDVLVEAFRDLSGQDVPVRLVVVGDGPYRDEMEHMLQGCPVTFTGYVEGEELPAIYASSDLFVFPSATDTFGNVVLEAQASGIPVVVSDQGGPLENMAPGETGLVFPAGDARALADAIMQLAQNEPMRREYGLAARAYIEQRSFHNAFSALYEMYVRDEGPGRTAQNDGLAGLAALDKTLNFGAA